MAAAARAIATKSSVTPSSRATRSSAPAPALRRSPIALAAPATVRLRPGPSSDGEPLSPAVRPALERSFGADLTSVRVRTDTPAQTAAARMGARAVAFGNQILLRGGESPNDLALMGHEVAHVLQQQGSPTLQGWQSGPGVADGYEREAHQASSAVVGGRPFVVRERTSRPLAQRLGISDALNFFADRANMIPGFRMFTIILGVNPINMQPVERSAANILRAIVEFIPGGALIVQALDNYGVFDRVGAWVDQQIRTLGLTGATIRQAVMDFVHSLSWSDIFDLGGVWDRARRIFTDPITRIRNFVVGLATGILRFIKEAILRPLARLAEGTRGYDLLKAVLGEDPITGEPVPRNAETLIGGFMRLIGQEEVWNNIRRANAIPRAWAWFQGALEGLLGFVRQIPRLFVQALQSLEIVDLVLVPRAFARVASVFASFAGRFLSWAGQQVMRLLEIIFEVVAPGAMTYIRRAAGAFRTIIQDPIRFVGNLVRAGIQGFRQFAANFLRHLRNSLIQWITGALSGANIYIPQAFTLIEIVKFVLSVLGLTWQNIRAKLVRAIGETAVAAMETGFDIVVTLVRDGPAAAWRKIQESLSNLRDMVMEQVMTFVRDRIVQAAITRLITSLNPAGAFIQAIIAIYNTIMFFIERMRQIAQVAMAFIDSISAIAGGVIGAAANRVEQTMAGFLTLVISFLARLVGLGRVSDAVTNVVNRIRQPIDRALDRVVDWIVATARRLGRFIAQAGVPQDPNERLRLAARDSVAIVSRLSGRVTPALISGALRIVETRYGLARLVVAQTNAGWTATGAINPILVWRLPLPGEAFGPGVREVGENPVTPSGVREAGVRGEILPSMPRATAPNYNTMMPAVGTLPAPVRHFVTGYQWAHAWGPGFGSEARIGLMLASADVNQRLQNRGRVWGLEGFISRIGRAVRSKGGHLFVEVTARSFPDPPPGVPSPLGQPVLREVTYRAVVQLPGGVELGGTASIRCGVPLPNGTGGHGTPSIGGLADVESRIPA